VRFGCGTTPPGIQARGRRTHEAQGRQPAGPPQSLARGVLRPLFCQRTPLEVTWAGPAAIFGWPMLTEASARRRQHQQRHPHPPCRLKSLGRRASRKCEPAHAPPRRARTPAAQAEHRTALVLCVRAQLC
jgi:hypothetical protein